MIVRETPWDDRNLGLRTKEISVLDTDSDSAVLSELNGLCVEKDIYCVIKIPQKRVALIHSLEDRGFRFLEAQADLHKSLRNHSVPQYLSKIVSAGSFVKIETAEECDQLISRLAGIFDSDRIFLDPFFGEKVSTQRYGNWIRDCFDKKEYHLCRILAGENNVGFFFIEEKGDSAADSALAGLFPEFKQHGYGPLIISAHIDYALALGKKKLVTRVSLNNTESLRMHLAFGYEITHSSYVMRYISKGV